jgi:Torus domain
LPADGSTIIDKTVKKEVLDYEAHKQKMEELQRKTLESMYPEFYATKPSTNDEVIKQSEL